MEILTPLYTAMRNYIIQALDMPLDAPVVRAYQNENPIPENAIIMCFRDDGNLDQLSNTYEDGRLIVFDSIQGTMQLDFYGKGGHDKARKIATLWKSVYGASILDVFAPLNHSRIRDLTFVNQAGQYEERYMIDLELQYNTKYEKDVNMIDDISVQIKGF